MALSSLSHRVRRLRLPILSVGCLLALLLLSATAVANETPSQPDLSAAEWDKIHDGHVHVELEEDESVNRGVIIGIVQAQINDVIPYVARCWEYGDWRDSLTDTSLDGRPEENVVICGGTAKTPFPARDRDGQFRVHNRVTDVDGQRSFVSSFDYIEGSGNMEDMFGYWVLRSYGPDGEHTLVKHVLNVDIGGWLPDFLVTWATRRTLPETINGLRAQVAGSERTEPDFWISHDYD